MTYLHTCTISRGCIQLTGMQLRHRQERGSLLLFAAAPPLLLSAAPDKSHLLATHAKQWRALTLGLMDRTMMYRYTEAVSAPHWTPFEDRRGNEVSAARSDSRQKGGLTVVIGGRLEKAPMACDMHSMPFQVVPLCKALIAST